MSCPSCKTFFRRIIKTGQEKFLCQSGGQCDINLNTRHICTACRLAKCFACGMSADLLRATRTKSTPTTKTLVRMSVRRQVEQLSTLNLLRSDASLLTSEQWTLLSNLIQIYQESHLTSIAQRFMYAREHDTIPSSTDIIYRKLLEEWGMTVHHSTEQYIRLNDDLVQLPSNDRSIIVRGAVSSVSCLGSVLVTQHYPLYELDAFCNSISRIFGQDVLDMHRWTMKFLDADVVLVKLALSLFVFSELTYSYFPSTFTDASNSLNILKVQNKYADVTWKYLLYRYGHHQAVQRFLRLTSWLAATSLYMADLQRIALKVDHVQSLAEETELKLILDDADRLIEMNE